MILRLWNGWTAPERADEYDRLLHDEVAPGIVGRDPAGLLRFEVWRRTPSETTSLDQFLTAMVFRDLEAAADFSGGDPGASVVPPAARRVLERFDRRSQHFGLRSRHV